MICKLCGSFDTIEYCKNKFREFYRCNNCELIFVPEKYYIDKENETVRYDLHDNTLANTGYVAYLEKCAVIVSKEIPPGSAILDFGSGKMAVLTELLRAHGYECHAYDPLYKRYLPVHSKKYDTIILCEVIEHLRNLDEEFQLIKTVAAKNAALVVRTQLYPSDGTFLKWWYMQDMTHINFFSLRSIEKTAAIFNCTVKSTPEKDIFVLTPVKTPSLL